MVELINKWKNASSALTATLGRKPFFNEVAKKLDLDPKNLGILRTALRTTGGSNQTVSLENMWTLSEALEDKNVRQPDQILFDSIEVDMIEKLLATLDDRESEILRMRYGLVDGDPMTLKETGERVNLSRERVRQIENESLKKLYCILAYEPETIQEP